jgi:hypothetical protein
MRTRRCPCIERSWLSPLAPAIVLALCAVARAGVDEDAAAVQLRQRGQARAIVFFRRPDAGQVLALIGGIRHSVEPAFGCPISLRGEPRFDEASGYWLVSHVASGAGCDDAAQELERLGAELQIRFMRTLPRVELLR